jgi:hypothetical protein
MTLKYESDTLIAAAISKNSLQTFASTSFHQQTIWTLLVAMAKNRIEFY